MAESTYFSNLNRPERGLNLSGFIGVSAPAPSAKEVALKEALQKGEAHVELFSEAGVLAYGKQVGELLQKGESGDLTPEEVLDLSKGKAEIASLTPLLLKSESGEERKVYARPKAKAEADPEEEAEKAPETAPAEAEKEKPAADKPE